MTTTSTLPSSPNSLGILTTTNLKKNGQCTIHPLYFNPTAILTSSSQPRYSNERNNVYNTPTIMPTNSLTHTSTPVSAVSNTLNRNLTVSNSTTDTIISTASTIINPTSNLNLTNSNSNTNYNSNINTNSNSITNHNTTNANSNSNSNSNSNPNPSLNLNSNLHLEPDSNHIHTETITNFFGRMGPSQQDQILLQLLEMTKNRWKIQTMDIWGQPPVHYVVIPPNIHPHHHLHQPPHLPPHPAEHTLTFSSECITCCLTENEPVPHS
eukprot:TRINITY_DN6584_c0_g1_i2.p1 TRINITY_DN6584_c0_g1~~TRINITY_DN6584_c0_g1_i2.p1  ORF type:complete len:267 (-),score=61.43 TRINITY_DN6584_c0_g1_i2:184-984(-)